MGSGVHSEWGLRQHMPGAFTAPVSIKGTLVASAMERGVTWSHTTSALGAPIREGVCLDVEWFGL